MLFLLKLLFLPIWLPVKIIGELIEHSGRARGSHRKYGGQGQTNGKGCMAVVLVIVVLAGIGAIADACSSGSTGQTAGNSQSVSLTPTVSASPTPSPSTAAHHARHRRHHHHSAPAVPVATHSAPPQHPSCYPLSNEGTCYEPGEFCRHSDEGATGVAGDGKRIKCEHNHGWRWEPI